MQSLMHACIFCTSNPRGQTTFFASYVLGAIRYPLEASSLLFSATFQIPCQIVHSLPSIAAIPGWYPAFSGHLHNLGTTIFCDPLTCAPTLTTRFHFRPSSVHQI